MIEAESAGTPPQDTGSLSDGYHTFDELYEHRTVLWACLCRAWRNLAWRADRHADGTMYDGMFIVGMTLPWIGEVSYHIENRYREWFSFVEELETAPPFTGYTSEDVISRLAAYFLPQTAITR